jgi:phosphatidylserine/phosphatidylglycerophosphate/cardiolipin synthase-like enzyme
MILKRILTIVFITFFPLLITSCANDKNQTNSRACFTPGENCIGDIVEAINQSKRSLLIQATDFSSTPIINAVLSAKQRGVDVRIIFDKSLQEKESSHTALSLSQSHIPVWIDNKVAFAHNNVMIIDDSKIITGGFSFTPEAQERNAENLIILTNPAIAKRYVDNWQSRVVLAQVMTNIIKANMEKHVSVRNKHRLAKAKRRTGKKKYLLAELFSKKKS